MRTVWPGWTLHECLRAWYGVRMASVEMATTDGGILAGVPGTGTIELARTVMYSDQAPLVPRPYEGVLKQTASLPLEHAIQSALKQELAPYTAAYVPTVRDG